MKYTASRYFEAWPLSGGQNSATPPNWVKQMYADKKIVENLKSGLNGSLQPESVTVQLDATTFVQAKLTDYICWDLYDDVTHTGKPYIASGASVHDGSLESVFYPTYNVTGAGATMAAINGGEARDFAGYEVKLGDEIVFTFVPEAGKTLLSATLNGVDVSAGFTHIFDAYDETFQLFVTFSA